MAEVTLLTLGDLHGGVEWTPALLGALEEADVLLLCGDLTNFGSPEDAASILDDLEGRCGAVYAVAGNCDSPAIEAYLDERALSLHGQGIVIEECIGVCGVSGSNSTPFGTPLEYTDEQLAAFLEAGWEEIEHLPVRIILHHAPPHGTTCDRTRLGVHVGVPGLRRFCEEKQPDLVICGHIHEARGRDTIGNTVVVNGGMAGRGRGTCIRIRDGALSVELL